VNKNTGLAFLLILVTVYVFSSPWYYEKVLKKPYPFGKRQRSVVTQTVEKEREDSVAVQNDTRELVGASAGDSAKEGGTGAVVADAAGDSARGDEAMVEEGDTVWVETEEMIVGITERGGAIVSVRMKDYGYRVPGGKERVDSLIELVPQGCDVGAATISVDKQGYGDELFQYEGEQERIVVEEREEATVTMVGSTPDGRRIEKEYSFEGDSYLIGLTVRSTAIAGHNLTVGWECGIAESEWKSGDRSAQYDRRKAHFYDGSSVERVESKKPESKQQTGSYRWIGVSSKYFLVAMIAEEEGSADVEVDAFRDTVSVEDEKSKNLNYAISMTRMVDDTEESYRIYAGPMRIGELRDVGIKLEKVLYGGWRWFFFADKWFPVLCEWMVSLLIGLHKLVRDYGVAILLVTVIVKAVTYPLSVSSMRSMARMKDVQPKINAIRQRYKSDPRKMNEELMELYRKEGINPFNPGCLPMFLQMPILFALFVVLRKAIELRGSSTVLVPWVGDLSQAEVLFRLPFELPMYGSNFALLPIVMAGVTFVQNKMTMKDPNQAAMVYVMPLVMLVLFNNFPAGLVMYWTFSSALQLVQQRILNKKQSTHTPSGGKAGPMVGKSAPVVAKGARKKRA
jgi:YidC/Oxa1 family membrane protein insertase